MKFPALKMRWLAVAAFSVLALWFTSRAQQNTPGCPSWTQWFGIWQVGGNVIMNTDGLDGTYKQQITGAAEAWNTALASKGIGVGFVNPPASSAHGASVTFELGDVIDQDGNRQVSVVQSTTYDANGYLVAATIRLDPNKMLTNSQGQAVRVLDNPANILKAVLHELGHTLGLGHHPFDSSQSCGGQTTPSVMNTMCGAEASNMPTAPTDCDKSGARESYFPTSPTPTPTPEGEYNPCGWLYGTYHDCDSPILIDVQGNGFSLTSASHGVDFDLNADGSKERIAWTVYGEDDAWLELDRNGNGIVDNGSELFGTVGFENGFLMLSSFDSNADGRITPQDTIFPELRLWRDLNHDGISQPGELTALAVSGIWEISLSYKENGRRDRFGNWFRYRAKVNGQRYAYDVFLTR